MFAVASVKSASVNLGDIRSHLVCVLILGDCPCLLFFSLSALGHFQMFLQFCFEACDGLAPNYICERFVPSEPKGRQESLGSILFSI